MEHPFTYFLLWIYLINTVLLILHEMDSAYWKEWDVFGLGGGIAGFLWMHIPIYALALYGLVLLAQGAPAGLWFALLFGLSGFIGFGVHAYFIRKGRPEFNTPASLGLLRVWLFMSLIQEVVTISVLLQPSQ
ncbi:MAG: hypothetical protein JXA69_07880 [Phycisphaerae bacterium]|nr:hypothetical protein [Phycisphaerae bacterium]